MFAHVHLRRCKGGWRINGWMPDPEDPYEVPPGDGSDLAADVRVAFIDVEDMSEAWGPLKLSEIYREIRSAEDP